jgi:hypothetical protein
MPSRARVALLLSSLLSIGAVAVGLELALDRGCDLGSGCNERSVALVVGIPLILLGLGQLAAAAAGWRRAPGLFAQASSTVWAAVLLLAAGAVGGADNLMGILLAVLAVAMGALSVWVPR